MVILTTHFLVPGGIHQDEALGEVRSMKPTSNGENVHPSALTCSTCGRRFYLDETDAPPFCSERCKMIDLGRWLDEAIEIPHEGGPELDERGQTSEPPSN